MPESKRHPARRPTQRQAKSSHKSPPSNTQSTQSTKSGSRGSTKNSSGSKAYAPGWRGSLERASVGPLFFLKTLPRLLVPAMLGILLIIGLAMPWHWTGLLLLLPAAFLAWLMLLSWPLLSPVGKITRSAAVIGLLIACVLRVTGHL